MEYDRSSARGSVNPEDDNDPIFRALPLSLQNRIDHAFDKTVSRDVRTHSTSKDSIHTPARKRRKLDPGSNAFAAGFLADGDGDTAGGFLLDDSPIVVTDDQSAVAGDFLVESTQDGGGFIIDDADASEAASATPAPFIPLSDVATALGYLNLPPDAEVLKVFSNAASGWSGSGGDLVPGDSNVQGVSRKDWRAVCAVLLDAEVDDEGEDGDNASGPRGGTLPPELHDSDDGGESDGYQESVVAGDSDDSRMDEDDEDEYVEGATSHPRRRQGKDSKKSREQMSSEEEDDPGPRTLSARQKKDSLQAFSLFFDLDETSPAAVARLEDRKIMIKDIDRVAGLLKEKITAEEIVEMLEAFSSNPDKAMSLSDFEQMMVQAKMV